MEGGTWKTEPHLPIPWDYQINNEVLLPSVFGRELITALLAK